jgi:hypothetical protein
MLRRLCPSVRLRLRRVWLQEGSEMVCHRRQQLHVLWCGGS